MSYPRYPTYKDSGVEWLGRVPEHWKVQRFKLSVEDCRNGIWGDEPKGDGNDIVCVRVADFDRETLCVRLTEPTIRNVTDAEQESRRLAAGDLLLEKSGGGEGQPVGCVVLYNSSLPAVCSNFVARMRLREGMEPVFWRYAHAAAYTARINTRSIKQTSGIQNLDQQAYLDEPFVFPPTDEQRQIAVFLGRETARIHALIEMQQRLIELLKEKRQAVISHAVTKGLNPSVAMKASGAEWLGEVPTHWALAPAKRLCSLIKDGTHLPPVRADEGVPLLSVRNMVDGRFVFRSDDSMISQRSFGELCRSFMPMKGDVLLAIVGATIGKTAIVDLASPFHIQRSVAVFRPHREVLTPSFLHLLFQSVPFQSMLWEQVGYSAQPGIYLGTLQDVRMPVPTVAEQCQIVEAVTKKTIAIDALIREAMTTTDLLQDRRAALVSAAVTGKIDVRHFTDAEAA